MQNQESQFGGSKYNPEAKGHIESAPTPENIEQAEGLRTESTPAKEDEFNTPRDQEERIKTQLNNPEPTEAPVTSSVAVVSASNINMGRLTDSQNAFNLSNLINAVQQRQQQATEQ